MKYLFISDSTGQIEFSCSGFIYDLVKREDEVFIIICNGSHKEIITQNETFASLGVGEENILINSFELDNDPGTYKTFVETQLLEIAADMVLIKDLASGMTEDIEIWKMVVSGIGDDTSIIMFQGMTPDDMLANPVISNFIVPISNEAATVKSKIIGDDRLMYHESFSVQRIIFKL